MLKFAACAAATLALLAVAGTAVVDAARPKWHQLTPDYSYKQYLADHGKVAPRDAAEFSRREAIFRANLRDALMHNADSAQLYRKGINHLSDRTEAELQALRGGRAVQMRGVAEELKKKPSYLGEHKVGGMPLPSSFDVRGRSPNILTAVKNQGMCGSCWIHATTEVVESFWAISTGNLFVLSTQQITSCAANPNQCGGTGGCQGGIFQVAMDYLVQAGGQTEEWSYPYTSYNGASNGECRKNIDDKVVRVSGYKMIEQNSRSGLLDALVVNNGPIAVNVDASAWSSYAAGIFNGCNYAQNISIDHVVNLVGYGQEYINNAWVPYLTIRNSWSAAYGEHGFIRILDTTACGTNVNNQDGVGCKNDPAVVTTCGMCGVLYSTGYPVVAP